MALHTVRPMPAAAGYYPVPTAKRSGHRKTPPKRGSQRRKTTKAQVSCNLKIYVDASAGLQRSGWFQREDADRHRADFVYVESRNLLIK